MLTDESIMNKLIDYAINADWKVKQHALTGFNDEHKVKKNIVYFSTDEYYTPL